MSDTRTITYRRAYNVRVEQTYRASVPVALLDDDEDLGSRLDEYVCDHGELISEDLNGLDYDDLEYQVVSE